MCRQKVSCAVRGSYTLSFMAALRFAHVHRAVGFFEAAPCVGMGSQEGYAGGSTCRDGFTVEHEALAIDRLLQ